MMFDNNISFTERKKERTYGSHNTKYKIQTMTEYIYKQGESNKMSPGQFFFRPVYRSSCFVLYSGDESGVDGDENMCVRA